MGQGPQGSPPQPRRVSLTAEGRGPSTNSSSCPHTGTAWAPSPGHKGVGDARGCTVEAQTAPTAQRSSTRRSEYTENLGERGLVASVAEEVHFVSKASHASN